MAEHSTLPIVIQAIELVKVLWGMTKKVEAVAPSQDAAIATASLELLSSTETGKVILDKIAALPEEEAHKLWEEMLAHGLPVEIPEEKK
jgi:hypothetical protein